MKEKKMTDSQKVSQGQLFEVSLGIRLTWLSQYDSFILVSIRTEYSVMDFFRLVKISWTFRLRSMIIITHF